MKNLLRILLVLSVVIMASCEKQAVTQKKAQVESVAAQQYYSPSGIVLDTASVVAINNLSKQVTKIDKEQLGLCDTCVASFQSAIIENRLLAERLAHESEKLRGKIQMVNEAMMTANQLVYKVEEQTVELQKVVKVKARLINETERSIDKVQIMPPLLVKK